MPGRRSVGGVERVCVCVCECLRVYAHICVCVCLCGVKCVVRCGMPVVLLGKVTQAKRLLLDSCDSCQCFGAAFSCWASVRWSLLSAGSALAAVNSVAACFVGRFLILLRLVAPHSWRRKRCFFLLVLTVWPQSVQPVEDRLFHTLLDNSP